MNPPLLHLQAALFNGSGKFDKTVLTLEEALEKDASRVKLYQPLTKGYAYLGMFDRAEQRVDELYFIDEIAQDGNAELAVGGHCRLALFKTMQQQSEEALSHVDAMISLDPSATYCAATFEAAWGDYEQAGRHLDQALERFSGLQRIAFLPRRIQIHRALGETQQADALMAEVAATAVALEAGELDAAIAAEFPGAADWSVDQQVQNFLAQAYALQGKSREAIAALRKAYEAGALMRYHWWKTINPVYQPLYDEPEFQQLLDDMSADIAVMRAKVAAAM